MQKIAFAASSVDSQKRALLERILKARLVSYQKNYGLSEEAAKNAIKVNLLDYESDFKKWSRQQDEQYALEMLTMEAEDCERAIK